MTPLGESWSYMSFVKAETGKYQSLSSTTDTT